MGAQWSDGRRDSDPRMVAVFVLFILIIVVVAALFLVVKWVAHIEQQERDCIKRNGVEYCRSIAP